MAFSDLAKLFEPPIADFQLALKKIPKPITLPKLKPKIRILTEDFAVKLFSFDWSELWESEPDTALEAAFQRVKNDKQLKDLTKRSAKCVTKGVGECIDRGSTNMNDLQPAFKAIMDVELKTWLDLVVKGSFNFAGKTELYKKAMVQHAKIAEGMHNCLEDEIEKIIVCKDYRKMRILVPCIKTECLDEK